MDTQTFRRFILVSGLFIAAPLPLFALMGFKSGDWTTSILGVALSAGLCLLYWWPLGGFLASYKERGVKKFFLGYLFSLVGYFTTLSVLYPLFGGAFRPWASGRFLVYLSATPQFYALVRILFYLNRRFRRSMLAAAGLTFATGLVSPFIFLAAVRLPWPARQQEVAIAGARIVDTASGSITDGQTVYIKDGRIEEIGPATVHPDWPRLDAHGQYLVPGLIDVHTHLQSPVEVPAGFQFGYFLKSMLGDYAPQRQEYLASGITSIRDLGGSAARGFKLRAQIDQHRILGPRLFFVGRLVTSPEGHPVSTIWQPSMAKQGAILAWDERSLLDGLNANLTTGPPDAVKFVHGTIGRAKEELSAELLAKGIRWSTDHHLISIVHVETEREFEDAISAGATGVEHAGYLQNVSESLSRLVAERHPFVDPTFGEFEMDLTMNKLSEQARTEQLLCSYKAVRDLRDAGAQIVVGTDAPMARYGSGFHDELAHFARAGFRPDQILAFATVNNAAYLGRGSELGRIAVGYRADLILVKDNPLEKLEALRRPVWTMLDGQIVFSSKQ